MNENGSSDDVTLYIVALSNPKPWAVAVSEACEQDAFSLKLGLGGWGYAIATTNFATTVINSSVCNPGVNIGNAIFMRGVSPTSMTHSLTQDPNDNVGEVRKVICNRTTTLLGDIGACSAHFTKNSGYYAQLQSNETLFGASVLMPGILKWIAGDFNMRPPGHGGTAVPSAWYSSYYEGDPANQPTRNTGIKNDFVFGSKAQLTPARHGKLSPVFSSDHYYYESFFSS